MSIKTIKISEQYHIFFKKKPSDTKDFNKNGRDMLGSWKGILDTVKMLIPPHLQFQVNIRFSYNAHQNPNTEQLCRVLIKTEVF